jgi:hypothetical protein
MPVTCFACERCLSKKAGLPRASRQSRSRLLAAPIDQHSRHSRSSLSSTSYPTTTANRRRRGCLAEQEAERAHRLRSMYSPLSARSPFPLRICDQHQMIAILIYADRRNRCCIRSSERLTSAFFLLLPSVPSRLVFDVILLPYRDLSLHRLLLRPSFALPPLPN